MTLYIYILYTSVESVLPSPAAPSFVMSNVVPQDPAGPSAGAAAGDATPSVLVARPDLFVAYAAHTAARRKSALIALHEEAIFVVQAGPLRRCRHVPEDIVPEEGGPIAIQGMVVLHLLFSGNGRSCPLVFTGC
jgi:hypothetical protein